VKCEICKANEATIIIKHVVDGVVRELHVCAECGREKGVDLQMALPLISGLLLGQGNVRRQIRNAAAGKICPVCHMRRSQFRKTSLLGCAVCYETFAEDVTAFLGGMPEDFGHVGKVPRRERLEAEIAGLERRLREAIKSQNYEEAARIRDRLRDVRAHGKKVRDHA